MKKVFILLCITALPLLTRAQNGSNDLGSEKAKLGVASLLTVFGTTGSHLSISGDKFTSGNVIVKLASGNV